MEKYLFFRELTDTLELDNIINETTNLHLTSLATLSIIVFIDEKFDKQIKANDFKNVHSIKALMELIGMERFE